MPRTVIPGKGRDDNQKQDGKTLANVSRTVQDWERARRATDRHTVGRLSVMPANLVDMTSQGKIIIKNVAYLYPAENGMYAKGDLP